MILRIGVASSVLLGLLCVAQHLNAQTPVSDALWLAKFIRLEKDFVTQLRAQKDSVMREGILDSFAELAKERDNLLKNYEKLTEEDEFLTCEFRVILTEDREALKKKTESTIAPTVAGKSISTLQILKKDIELAKSDIPNTSISGIPSPQSFAVTLADGIAKFLIKRAKQELTLVFIQKFKSAFDSSATSQVFQALFPKTYEFFGLFSKEYEFNSNLAAFREAFVQDLRDLPLNTRNWLAEKQKELQDGHQEIVYALVALDLAIGVADGQHPADIVETIGSDQVISQASSSTKKSVKNFANSVKLLRLLSWSLRSNVDGAKAWVSADELQKLFGDTTARRIFFGMLYQKNESDGFNVLFCASNSQVSVKNFLTVRNIEPIVSAYKESHRRFLAVLNSVGVLLKKSENGIEIKYEDVRPSFYSTLDLLELFVDPKGPLRKFYGGSTTNEYLMDTLSLRIVRNSFDLFGAIKQRNFAAGIVNTMCLVDELWLKRDKEMKGNKLKSEFIRYGTFMAAVAQANNSDEVEQAIESIALPVGSASIKKHTKFNVALNGYLGVSYGGESIKANGTTTVSPVLSLFAPIGVALSWGMDERKDGVSKNGTSERKDDARRGSFSVFFSIIDVGAVASFRLGGEKDKAKILPEFEFRNILAPGIHLVCGIPDLPISCGAGFQYGPQLRKLTDSNAEISSVWRFAITLAIDIPIIDFHSEPRDDDE